MIDAEFIARCENMFEDEAEKLYQKRLRSITRWNNENREFLRECIKNYEKTEKGAYAVSKRNSKRTERMRELYEELSWEEKADIGNFYRNCPDEYEVDHIIPVSKGGEHKL